MQELWKWDSERGTWDKSLGDSIPKLGMNDRCNMDVKFIEIIWSIFSVCSTLSRPWRKTIEMGERRMRFGEQGARSRQQPQRNFVPNSDFYHAR
jgi:hypothetical protein